MDANESQSLNHLRVVEATSNDNSVVVLSPAKMAELELFRGDTVLLTGNEGKETVCIILAGNETGDANIHMNEVNTLHAYFPMNMFLRHHRLCRVFAKTCMCSWAI